MGRPLILLGFVIPLLLTLARGVIHVFLESMYVRCKGKRGGPRESFKIDSCVREGCIMSPWLFNVYMNAVMKVKMEMRRVGVSGKSEDLWQWWDVLLRCVDVQNFQCIIKYIFISIIIKE